MSQELFNMMLANSPFLAVLLYFAKKIGELGERIARIEGALNVEQVKK